METGCHYNQAVLEEVVVRVFADRTTKKQMAGKSSEYQEWSIGNSKGGQLAKRKVTAWWNNGCFTFGRWH